MSGNFKKCCYIILETLSVIRASEQNISFGKKCKIDVFIGNDDGKLVGAWKNLCALVEERNYNHKKNRMLLVNGGGVKLFLKCMEKFPGNTTLLYTMTGCFSEVILDENLRPKMMNQDFAKHIITLADTPDFTDLSSCAIEVLCHMLKDGKVSWRKTKLRFTDTLTKIDTIHDNWDISNVKTNLMTPNFESKFVFRNNTLEKNLRTPLSLEERKCTNKMTHAHIASNERMKELLRIKCLKCELILSNSKNDRCKFTLQV